jgi:hypothetical protein
MIPRLEAKDYFLVVGLRAPSCPGTAKKELYGFYSGTYSLFLSVHSN